MHSKYWIMKYQNWQISVGLHYYPDYYPWLFPINLFHNRVRFIFFTNKAFQLSSNIFTAFDNVALRSSDQTPSQGITDQLKQFLVSFLKDRHLSVVIDDRGLLPNISKQKFLRFYLRFQTFLAIHRGPPRWYDLQSRDERRWQHSLQLQNDWKPKLKW